MSTAGVPKVLVVDDEVIVATSLCFLLRDLGYQTLETAASGEKAIEIARRDQPDFVLMDIGLAGAMDGIEAAKRINAEQSTPVCFITGFSTRDVRERAQGEYVVALLEKPLDTRRLKSMVEDAISRAT